MRPPSPSLNLRVVQGACAALSLSLIGCGLLGVEESGSRCGGAQYAYARISLPDSGISAGSDLVFGFTQRDPYLIGEQTDISVQQVPMPPGTPLTLPHVRLVHDDGRVLLEQAATTGSLGGNWLMTFITHSADLRVAVFEGLASRSVSLQLVRWPTDQPGT